MVFIKQYDLFNESLYLENTEESISDIIARQRLTHQPKQYSEDIYDTPENQEPHFTGFTSPNYHFMCHAPSVGDIYLYHDSYPAIGQPRKMFIIKTGDGPNDMFYKGPEDVYNENTPIDRALRYVKNSKKFKSFYGIV